MHDNRHTLISALVAAWLGFPIGAIFATITLRWWVIWMVLGVLLAIVLAAHIRYHRKDDHA